MNETDCPSCSQEFDKKMVFEDGRDFSVSATHADLEQVCVFHVTDEKWVYLHLATETLEAEFEHPDDADEPLDLSGMVEDLREESDA